MEVMRVDYSVFTPAQQQYWKREIEEIDDSYKAEREVEESEAAAAVAAGENGDARICPLPAENSRTLSALLVLFANSYHF